MHRRAHLAELWPALGLRRGLQRGLRAPLQEFSRADTRRIGDGDGSHVIHLDTGHPNEKRFHHRLIGAGDIRQGRAHSDLRQLEPAAWHSRSRGGG
jgi:hypothetical protein